MRHARVQNSTTDRMMLSPMIKEDMLSMEELEVVGDKYVKSQQKATKNGLASVRYTVMFSWVPVHFNVIFQLSLAKWCDVLHH